VLLAAVGLSVVRCAAAQLPPGEAPTGEAWFAPDRQALQALRRAEQLLAERRWIEMAEHLDYLLGLEQDAFFQPDKAVPLYRSIKSHATALLARLPSEGWQACELRYGTAAQRVLNDVLAAGRPEELALVARRYFHTRAGAEAAYLMAEYELDRGFALAAAAWYARLAQSPLAEAYEPMLSVKWALAGMRAGLPETLQAARQRMQHRAAHGVVHWGEERLALHDDTWWHRAAEAMRIASGHRGSWPLAGGDVTGNAPQQLDLWSQFPRWQASQMAGREQGRTLRRTVRQMADAGEAVLHGVQPLVVHDLIVSRTALQVQAFDRHSGRLRWQAPFVDPHIPVALDESGQPPPELQRLLWDDRHTAMASDGERVYVLEALEPVAMADAGLSARLRSAVGYPVVRNQLLAYDLRSGKLVWQRVAGGESSPRGEQSLSFLGTPLPLAGTLYVLLAAEQECQLAALEPRTGNTLWSQPLLPVDPQVWRNAQRALAAYSPSYAQGVLVCPTGAGAAVAFDPAWRSLVWCYRYGETAAGNRPGMVPQTSSDAAPLQRWRHTACVLGENVALLSPADSDELHCLDLLSGTLRWKEARGTGIYVAGLRQQRVVVVGRDGVRAHDVHTGHVLWEQKFPEGASLYGRAACGATELAVPVSSGTVYVYSLADGALQRQQSVPAAWGAGNLLAAGGLLLWQGLDALTCLDLHSHLQQRVAALHEPPSLDRAALLDRGRLLLHEGRLDEAVRDLWAAYEAAPDEPARKLLTEALLVRLESLPELDSPAAARLLNALHELAALPVERERLAWLSARAAEASGDAPRAVESYLQLLGIDEEAPPQVVEGVQLGRTAQVLMRLAELYGKAPSAVAAQMDDLLRAQHAASDDGGFRHWLLAALGGRWSQSLSADDAALPQTWTAADELWLQQLVNSGPSPLAVAAARGWAQAMHAAQRHDALLRAVRGWQTPGSEAPDSQARPFGAADSPAAAPWPAPLADELARGLESSPYLRLLRHEAFAQGEARATLGAGQGQGISAFAVATQRPLPGTIDLGLRAIIDAQWQTLYIVDALGHHRFRVRLAQRQQLLPATSVPLCRAWFVGHLLLFSNGRELWGIDLLGAHQQPRVLWRHELVPAVHWRNLVRTARTAWGEVRTDGLDGQGQPIPQLVLLDPRRMAVLRHGRLSVLDTLSGQTLWSRDGLAASARVWGDGQRLIVLQPQPQPGLVLDALSGAELRRGNAPAPDQIVDHDGIRLLVWDTLDGAVRLRLWDAWTQRDVWQHRFAAGTQACSEIAGELWLVQPDGDCRVVRVRDGQERLAVQLPRLGSIDTLQLVRFAQCDVLLVNERTSGTVSSVLPLAWSRYGGLLHGMAYGLDRASGRLIWSRRVERQSPAPVACSEVPVLLFAARWLQRDPNGGAVTGYSTQALCLDVRSGATLYEGPLGDYTNTVELLGDPQRGTVEVRAMQASLRIVFSPPQPPLEAP
jgi:outer membrane protein assembly factor BamB